MLVERTVEVLAPRELQRSPRASSSSDEHTLSEHLKFRNLGVIRDQATSRAPVLDVANFGR